MIDEPNSAGGLAGDQALMDELLRAGVPELKLALGAAIDRENARPLPPRYARLLPETVLVVTLRDDAAAALAPIAADLERELTDSCNRHGSLYDRGYRVQLQRSEDPESALYHVVAHAGRDLGADAPEAAPPGNAPPAIPNSGQARGSETPPNPPVGEASRRPSAPAPSPAPPLPVTDPEATRTGPAALGGWEPGRWLLVVQDEGGEEREVFRLAEPTVTVGRRTDDPELRATIAISDAPHVSRRQLALSWEERNGAPGFRLFNLGLNSVHLPDRDIPGARSGRERLDLSDLPEQHTGWVPPGVPVRIGEHGPLLRIEDVPPESEEPWIDPDATVFE